MQDHVGELKMPTYDNPLTAELRSNAVAEFLKNEGLCLFLANTDEDVVRNENSIEAFNDVSSIACAFKITPKDVRIAIPTAKGEKNRWETGRDFVPGIYTDKSASRLANQGQPYWAVSSKSGPDMLALIVGASGVKNRIDLISSMGKPEYNLGLEKVNGDVATSKDGWEYCIIGALPDGVSDLSNKYIPLETAQMASDNLLKYSSTSLKSEASNICGPGNESSTGTCCLYHREGGYDSISETSFSAGKLYKCVETKCYSCIELAKSLNKEYRFNRWAGDTGERCLGGTDTDNYPTDCGPCSCNIDWNEKSYFQNIINNLNIPVTSSADMNSRLIQYGQDNLSGAVSSAMIDLGGLTKDDLLMSSEFTSDTSRWVLPLTGDGTGCEIRFATEKDVNGNVRLVGFEAPTNHGKNYSQVSVNKTSWESMFPNISYERVVVSLFPKEGPAGGIRKIVPQQVIAKVTLDAKTINDASDGQRKFNRYGIAKFKTSDGTNILSGAAPEQSVKFNTATVIQFQNANATELSSEGKGGGTDPTQQADPNSVANSTFKDRFITETIANVNSTTLKSGVRTKDSSKYEVGNKFTDDEGTEFTVTSITKPSSPLSSDLEIDLTNTEVVQRNVTSLDLDKMAATGNAAAQHTISFEIVIG